MSKYKTYQVAEIPNYNNMKRFGFMISQPKNYFGTMLVINVGMGLMYAFSTDPDYWYLIVLAVLAHVGTMVFMLMLAWVDPGIIPKIFSNYELPAFRKIPISHDYITGIVSE